MFVSVVGASSEQGPPGGGGSLRPSPSAPGLPINSHLHPNKGHSFEKVS